MKKAKPTLKNIIAYIQGNLRYKLFYSNFAFLIRPHIREQIEVRINSMDPICYGNGECKMCGCQTTSLQMANKACDKPCYPRMLSRKEWFMINLKKELYVDNKLWHIRNNKFLDDDTILFDRYDNEEFEIPKIYKKVRHESYD